MDKEPSEKSDGIDGPFLTLGDLYRKVPTATLASAIENHGIFMLDDFGGTRLAADKDEAVALETLKVQRSWDRTPLWRRNKDFVTPEADEVVGDDPPFGKFGWAKEMVPDALVPYLENVRQDQVAQQRWREFTQPKMALERQIAKWRAIDVTLVGERAQKEDKLAELERKIGDLELKHLKQKRDDKADTSNWKLLIQAEAARLWTALRETGANPTKNSIKIDLARWCRENNVKGKTGTNPTEEYISRHVLRKWTPPKD